MVLHERLAFYSVFFNIQRSGVLTALAWLVPHETAAVSAQVLCTPYNHAPCHFMQSHIRKVHACLAVTCHLHFWQNDRDLLRATAVTRGWNGYRNKSQHRKSTLEKKILPPLQQGFEPVTFRSRVWRSNHWAIPAPLHTTWPTKLTGHYLLTYFDEEKRSLTNHFPDVVQHETLPLHCQDGKLYPIPDKWFCALFHRREENAAGNNLNLSQCIHVYSIFRY